jgi:Cdc6-like AAA superfamily ATPase
LLVLDDLAFLLANDGNDLLYFLSRLDRHADLCIIGIGTRASLTSHLDERTYSSLRPHDVTVESYTEVEAVDILAQRAETALPPDTVEREALDYIAGTTTNLTLGLYWLTYAATHVADITVDMVRTVQHAALQRYRNALLQEFTSHHRVLLDAVDRTTDDESSAFTGTVYTSYVERCKDADTEPLTMRRISDYLTHLELLNLIDVTHHDGGETGKTREIRPTPLQQL